MNPIKKIATRSGSPDEVFEPVWEDHGMKATTQDAGAKTTTSVQNFFKNQSKEEIDKNFKGQVRKTAAKMANGDMQTKAMDSGATETYTPLVFDPEIVSILKQNAPLLDVIPEEGQEGFKAVYNIVDSREDPIGFTSEGDAINLLNNNESDISFAKSEVDMTIWTATVNISDFTQEAASHYMNVEQTTLGEQVAQHAQRKAQQILYGDPSQDTGTGYLGDSEGFKGLKGYAEDAGNDIDKTGVSSNYVKDIKKEINSMKQDENVNVNNLVIACSWEMFDKLENEADFDNLRTDPSDQSVNVGLNQLSIAGVPVRPTHNIDSYTDGSYTPGDNGDVFNMSTRTARYRALMPMSMVPLAKNGLGETTALAEFGALIEKSQGSFVRYLYGYDI